MNAFSLDHENNQIDEVKVIDATSYSYGFPNENWKELIQRSNYLAQIENSFNDSNRIVFIEGEEDAGKTTIAAQFVKKNIKNTISVFFNPLNALDYNLDFYCTNAVLQISHLLNEEIPENEISLISTEQFRQKLFQYRKALKKGRQRLNIVIDGLEQKVKTDPQFIRELFPILHLGENSFRFIISGYYKDFVSAFNPLSSQECKSVHLTGFSDFEVQKYLNIQSDAESYMSELYNVTKGYPGRLRTLKRLIENEDYSLDKISSSTSYNSWLEIDCESINLDIAENNAITSLLTLSDNSYSLEDISRICAVDKNVVVSIVCEYSIFSCKNDIVSIVSHAHKRYLSNILYANKQKINDLLIDFYLKNESVNSLLNLPQLYSSKKEWEKVIQILDEQHINKVLEQTGSLKFVNENLELGLRASENLSKYPDLLRFSIQGSLVNELDNYLFWESEIEARISLQDFSGAISLAESAIILVDRLLLLALIARRQKEFNNKVDEVLIQLIKDLYVMIDLSSAGDKIYDIVSHLIHVLPNIAIEMIERSSDGVTDNNINDWVIAKLSIAAIDSDKKEGERGDLTKRLQAVPSFNNPSVKKVNRAISVLVGNYSSIKVLEEVKKISDSTEKLRLLRLWLRNNRNHSQSVEKVISAALNEMAASSSETSITIEVLEELSSQLPYVRNKDAKKELFYKFKNISKSVLEFGMVKSKYIFQLNMFHVEYDLYQHQSIDTIDRIIKDVDSLDDELIRIESLAEVFVKLSILNSSKFKGKINFIYARLLDLTSSLFYTTALQFEISEYFLYTIGKQNPRLALKIVKQMNNVERREKSRLHILDAYLSNDFNYLQIDLIKELEGELEESISRFELSLETLERFSEAKILSQSEVVQLLYFQKAIKEHPLINERLRGSILIYKISQKEETWARKIGPLWGNIIYQYWKSLESDWERIDEGFRLCYELAKVNPDLSKKIFVESEQLKQNSWFDSKPVAYTYLNSFKLIIRSFNCLLVTGLNSTEDIQIVEDLIARIPSELEKLAVWTEFGFFAFLSQNDSLFKTIINEHVIHLLHDLTSKKISLGVASLSFTLIHLFNPILAAKYIEPLRYEEKEQIYIDICRFYTSKRNPFEPYEPELPRYFSTFSDLTAAIDALKHVKIDSNIYYLIDGICSAIKKNDNEINKVQVSKLVDDISEIINSNLPDKRNISHDGFKLLAELKVAKISKHLSITPDFWGKIIEKVDTIPNLSDIIFVKAIILEDFPFEKLSNGNQLKRTIFDSVIEGLDKLPVHYEFVERVIDITDKMYSFDPKAWKKCVDKAFNISASLKDGSDIYRSQRNIIDSMYRLDQGYAKELIKQLDNENQQKKINKLLVSHFQTLEIANKIKNNKTLEQKDKENSQKVIQSVFMTLKGLNSDRILPKKVSEIASYLQYGNQLPLHEVFPVFVYYFNNIAKMHRTAKDDNIVRLLKDNFRVIVSSTNIIQLLSQKKKNTEKSYRKFFIDEDFASNKPIKPRSREDAFKFIKNWLNEQTEEFIIIADPYFEKEDLEILKLIKQANINVEVDILGSKDYVLENCEIQYKQYWKKISDEDPPFVNLTFCRTAGNSEPFHDRWIITKNSGLRLGTSINSLGMNKEGEISVMRPNEALKIREQTLHEFITRRKRELNNERLSYKGFTID